MSLKLSTSVADVFGFISRFDSAMTLPPEPDLGPEPERADGESVESFTARAEAWAAPLKAWERPLEVARATGDYTPITSATIRPTIFKMRPITVSQWGRLDAHTANMTRHQRAQLIFRVVVVGLDGDVPMEAHDKKMARAVDKSYPDLGPIQPEAFVDLFKEKFIDEVAIHVRSRRFPSGN